METVQYNLGLVRHSMESELSHYARQSRRFRKGPPPTSCDLCKKWKVKCNRNMPKCNTCSKHGSECTYNYAQQYWSDQQKTKIQREPSIPLIHAARSNQPVRVEVASEISQLLASMAEKSPSLKHSIAKYFIKLNPKLAPFIAEHVRLSPTSRSRSLEVISGSSEACLNDLGRGLTRILQHQLVSNYFRYLNAFYPLLDEDDFLPRMVSDTSPAFIALLNVVCLIGLGYLATPSIVSRLAPALGTKVRVYLMRCYTRPSIELIQACILLSHYCSTDEDDGVFQSNWLFLGMAQQMALQLGLNVFLPRRSTKEHLLCWRIWCVLAVDDILIEHCMGLPASLSTEFGFLSPQYLSPSLRLTENNPSFRYLRTAMIHFRLLPFVARLRNRHSRVAQTPTLVPDWQDTSVGSDPEFLLFSNFSLSLESLYHQWYVFIPDFVGHTSHRKGSRRHNLGLCDPSDQFSGLLLVFYYSTLVEIYRPLILRGLSIKGYQFVLSSNQITTFEFSKYNPLEKAAISAHFGVMLFQQSGILLADLGHPYLWYCVMNMIFIHLYLFNHFPAPHPIAETTRSHLVYLSILAQYGSQKCAIVRDLLHTMDPLLRAFRPPPP
ncbi:hypothetical protein DSO57_1021293 [Entomophthora muscae]|uniref:Uncharacterized protein n=1 Tax=Entomophthora muscae TaxID=34485 RepID=A0ACC2TRV8_9FUNG|nr:hypothetical protein DSO57_1021293 [Entomophthora muscae]